MQNNFILKANIDILLYCILFYFIFYDYIYYYLFYFKFLYIDFLCLYLVFTEGRVEIVF